MKSSVPWLLISSAITLPLSSIVAAEEAVVEVSEPKVSQSQNGNVNLGPSDNYPGTGGNGSGFTYKETSTPTGTIYTLTGDVSISNVTATQAPASSNQPEVQSQPKVESIEKNGAESENGKSNSESDKENKNASSEGDSSTSSGERSSTEPKIEESSSAESPQPSTTVVSTENNSSSSSESTEVTSNSGTETVTTSRVSSRSLRADIVASDASSSSSSDSSNPNGSQVSQTPTKSCFSNTAGPLTFVGASHSLIFDTVTIEAQGAAINNSAGSALTLSGFSNLSFTKSTNQDQTKADSAIYVGPKKSEVPANGGVGVVPGASSVPGNSVSNSASEPNAAASLWMISSDTSASEKGSSGENSVASPKAAEEAASTPAIILKENVNITFSGNSSKKAGGAINVDGGSATIENNTGICTFSNNNAKEQGGAVSVTGNFDIAGNKTVVFSGNKAEVVPSPTESPEGKAAAVVSNQAQTPATGTGGAIHCLAGDASVPAAKAPEKVVAAATEGVLPSIRAVSLSADSPAPKVEKQADAAAAADPCVTISGNTTVTFDNNSSTVSGGAIHTKKLVLSSGGDITFSNNSSGKGGAIFITDGGDIRITAATGSITFQGNTVTTADPITIPAKPQAGAADSAVARPVSSNGQADAPQANAVQPEDGKIVAAFATFANAQVDAKAKADQNQPQKPSHNAIHLGSGATISQLRAGTGQTIFFYDPITTTKPAAASAGSSGSSGPAGPTGAYGIRAAAVTAAGAAQAATPKTPLKINAPDAQEPALKEAPVSGETKQATYNGTIVFSGEKLSAEDAKNPLNAMSVINTDVSLEAGTLVLRSGAGLLVDSFVQKDGSLIIMDGGTSIITNVPAVSNPSSKAASVPTVPNNVVPVVNASSKSDLKIISDLVASSLINFKPRGPSASAPAVSNSQVQNPDGSITITNLAVNLDSLSGGKVITLAATGTGNVTLTGDLKFQDSSQNFYDNPMLNKNFSANILDISTTTGGKVNTEGFNMIPQGSTSSNVGYQGKWEVKEVKDASGKVSFELQWISTGYTPTPNRRATLVPNSLWCSAIDIRAIQQLVEVSTQGEDFHKGIWISGISNFFHRDSMKVQKGFRHISSGYVVGASTQPITDRVIDIAFCQMFGKSKDYHLAKTRSHIYAASIHTKREKLINHYKLSNKKGSILNKLPEQMPVIFDAQLSYSLSHNSMTTKHTPDPSSKGKWNNHCVAGELGSYLPIVIDNPFIEEFSPFMKLHVVFVQQEDFKETKGGDANRNFQSAHFVNISLPIGMKFEKTNKYNIYNISLIYQPDIYRDAPKSKVFLPSTDTGWSTGATNLARQALIIDGCNHHHLTDSFEVFCHGAFELRESSRNYNLDLGGRYKF
ncbi:polymorphic outer membrane protein middle domain-containing protein [Chlamydia crocodili]|uniref:Pmp family polymorphic membrane protein autotransporter adhesin n=1 Tax=Chlamydia crocodili TaxID=2766982 RepID=A0ABX8CI32_9CHLA|nr:polymorphic outer membrane protein middle domain-containing protein [Chlamydia crocodili]QVE48837.1 Pmp family polymorphic membrane protein autotransporter adhesin [Chlamydia crocodili]